MRWRVTRLEATDSTNERAFAALAAGDGRCGDVWVAGRQSAGRGRLGRLWHSPPGEGLYLTALFLLPPGRRVPAPAWTLAGGLAVWRLVRGLGVAEAGLRWPNDLVVRGAKLAGVLAESRPGAGCPEHCVLGIGLNAAQTRFDPQLAAERPVTSLARLGIERRPEDLVAPLLEQLGPLAECALEGGAALAAPFLEALGLAGRPVRAETSRGAVSGRLAGLDLPAGLRLATGAGERRLALEHVLALAPSDDPGDRN